MNTSPPRWSLSIHEACDIGDCQAVQDHLPLSLECRSLSQQTPLHVACSNDYLEIVKILVKSNANIQALDDHGRTPLMLAFKHQSNSILEDHELLAQLYDVPHQDCDGNTEFHFAVRAHHYHTISSWWEHDWPRNKRGQSPQELAVSLGIVLPRP
jgi:ankyrin repeat protein